MKKVSNRDKILSEGLRVVNERGFSGASVRDIVSAAGVPQGSFTNHFASKVAFGLEILDIYFSASRETINATLRNDDLPPLKRLGLYIDANRTRLNRDGMRNGCLLGNFAIEASDENNPIHERLAAIFDEVRQSLAYCLKAAVKQGELPKGFKSDEIAAFILSSLQGAILIAKVDRSPAPVDRFKKVLFASVLR